MRPSRYPGLGVLLAVGLLLAAGAPADEKKPEEPKAPPREKVVIRGEVFELEIAADYASRARGLMGREKIEDHGGMLFVYRDSRPRTFWMKNCRVDIDLLYLGSKGRIVRVHRMKKEPPRREDETEWQYEWRLKSYPSRRPAQYVIELKAGTIDRLKLRRGQTIELDRAKLRKIAR
jgi:uncharacterized membrane protein (UPF0127 family)